MNDSGNLTSIIIALIGIIGIQVGAIVWFGKTATKEVSGNMRANTVATVKGTNASIAQAKASHEVLTFMRQLNGKLANATIQTHKENIASTKANINNTQAVEDNTVATNRNTAK